MSINDQFEEVKKLYNLSESDIVCLTQLFNMVRLTGFSQELTVKLMRALTTMMEITLDDKKANQKK